MTKELDNNLEDGNIIKEIMLDRIEQKKRKASFYDWLGIEEAQ